MASGTGIGEFVVSLTVDAANGALTVGNLVNSFGELEIASLGEIAILWELSVLLARVTDAGIKASLGFEQFSMHTGLSAQELQKWQIIAQQAHASAEDVTGSVENLTKHLANLAIGIPDSSLASLQQLGISAFDASGKLKTAFDILGEVRARLGAVTSDAGQQERILAGLGISANLRETLLLSQQRFDGLAGTAHGMTKGEEERFNRLRDIFVDIKLVTGDIALHIGAWVAHILELAAKLSDIVNFFKFFRDQELGEHKTPITKEQSHNRQVIYDILNLSREDRDQLKGIGSHVWSDIKSVFGGAPAEPAAARDTNGPSHVTINKNDTYHIHDAHDPHKIMEIIDRSWDETLQKKTVDGFDRQLNNGGY